MLLLFVFYLFLENIYYFSTDFFFGDKFVRLKPKSSVHSLFVQLSTSNHI